MNLLGDHYLFSTQEGGMFDPADEALAQELFRISWALAQRFVMLKAGNIFLGFKICGTTWTCLCSADLAALKCAVWEVRNGTR